MAVMLGHRPAWRYVMTDQGRFTEYLRRLCDLGDQAQHLPLSTLLAGIPRLSALEILPGQAVIVRADLDVPLDGERVLDRTRLESCVQTLRHCIDAGAKVVLIGHLGRTPSASLKPVAE